MTQPQSSLEYDFTDLAPERGEHLSLFGLTGSGKTHVIKMILPYCKNVVVIDPKRKIDPKGYNVITRAIELPFQMMLGRFPILYKPNETEIDSQAAYNAIFRAIFKRGNVTVYVDEMTPVATATKWPRYMALCSMQGRELGISVISCSQGPTFIPSFSYRQASIFICFYLNDEAERAKVRKFVRGYDAEELRKYEFYWYRIDFDGAAMKCILPGPDDNRLSA